MKIKSVAFATVVSIIFAGVVAAQPATRLKVPRAEFVNNEVVADGLKDRVQALATCGDAGTISCGGSRTGTNSSCTSGEYYFDFWQFYATAGQSFTATVNTSRTTYEILVAVQASDGTVLASNFGTGRASVSFTPASAATYYVSVGYLAKYYFGQYTLDLTCGTGGGGGGAGQCEIFANLQRGVPVNASLGTSTACSAEGDKRVSRLFAFDAKAEEPVSVTITSTVGIWGESYAESQTDWSYAGSSSSSASTRTYVYWPTVTGRHYVWIAPYSASVTSGSYTVTIKDEDLSPCRRRAVRN